MARAKSNTTSAPRNEAVFVRGLEFEGNHGYSAAERRSTRRFRVNVTLATSLGRAKASDRLGDTVDYWQVCDIIYRLGTTTTYKLLEALAGAMLSELARCYPHAGIELELEKLAAPCPGVPAACGVRVCHAPSE